MAIISAESTDDGSMMREYDFGRVLMGWESMIFDLSVNIKFYDLWLSLECAYIFRVRRHCLFFMYAEGCIYNVGIEHTVGLY